MMTIEFGALAPSLRDQLGSTLPMEFQDDADAITRLHVRGILAESAAILCRHRLIRSIERDARKRGLIPGAKRKTGN